MKKPALLFAIVLILLAMGGCDNYAAPVSGALDTASPAATQPVAVDTDTASGLDAVQTLPPASSAPTDSPTVSAPNSAQPTASPTATPTPSASPKTATPSPSATATAPAGFLQAEPITGTADVVNYLPLRASPSNTSATLQKIPKDGSVTVLKVAQNTDWLKVSYSGEVGYVLAKYVKIGGDAANRVCTVISGAVNMRSGAGKKFNVLGILEKGATMIVTGQTKASAYTWYEVHVGNDTGYVYAQDCRISAT